LLDLLFEVLLGVPLWLDWGLVGVLVRDMTADTVSFTVAITLGVVTVGTMGGPCGVIPFKSRSSSLSLSSSDTTPRNGLFHAKFNLPGWDSCTLIEAPRSKGIDASHASKTIG
jgi:hypothetical protein